MKNANDQNFFNFVGGGLRQRVIRYYQYCIFNFNKSALLKIILIINLKEINNVKQLYHLLDLR